MRFAGAIACVALLCGEYVAAQSLPADSASLEARQQAVFRAALRTIAPCVVKIETIGGAAPVQAASGDDGEIITTADFRQADGPSTGVIWSADGYILTSSFNFVRDPSVITVTLHDGRSFLAKLVARDRPARLALLQIAARDLPMPTLVSPGDVRPGQWALAAGFGVGGREPAVSVGVVSGVRRLSGLAIQTDAKISPANYGGPLFDVAGQLLGICVPATASPSEDDLAGLEWYDSGIGFAIHIDHVRARLPALQRGQDVRRGVLGLDLDATEPVVGASTQPAHRGVRVVRAAAGPGSDAGLRPDDWITQVDGVAIERPVELRRQLAARMAGDSVDITFERDGRPGTVRLTLITVEDFAARNAQRPTSQPTSAPER